MNWDSRARISLEQYGLQGAAIERLNRGSVQVFRVVSPAQEQFVLRLYRKPAPGAWEIPLRSPRTLHSQLLWLSALRRETDLLLPDPVLTAYGDLIGQAPLTPASLPWHRSFLRWVPRRSNKAWFEGTEAEKSLPCVLLRWVPGAQKGRDSLGSADLSLVGSLVASLHRHAERYHVSQGATLPRWDWELAFGESAPLWSIGEAFYSMSELEVYNAASQRVRRDLRELGESSDVFGLVHNDLRLSNLTFHKGRAGVIDFDACGLGYYLYDLAGLWMSLRESQERHPIPSLGPLLEGYESERSLPKDYQRYMKTFTVMRRVVGVNRELRLSSLDTVAGRYVGPRFLSSAVRSIEKLLEG